jgi:DNA invertase Pin-like site-specific DNA recombinase
MRINFLIRVSTDKQDIKRQEADIDRIIKKYGAEIVRVIPLEGVSGTATLTNEQVQQVLRELENPDIDGLGLSSLDRLFRPGKRFGQYAMLDSFIDANKKMWTVREGEVDPATSEGAAKCTQAFGAAGAEWRNKLQESTDGRRVALEAGRPINCTPCYGHTYVDKHHGGPRFEINETQAAVTRDFCGWILAGMTPYAVAGKLNNLGILSAGHNGKPPRLWTDRVIRQILHNTSLVGQKKQGNTILPVPRIIDDETFDDIQRILATNKAKHQGKPSNKYLLRTYLWCAKPGCGHRMMSNPGHKAHGKHSPAYVCSNIEQYPPKRRICQAPQIMCTILEAVAWGAIWDMLLTPELLLSMGQAYIDSLPRDTETESLEGQLSEHRAHLARVKEMTERRMYSLKIGEEKSRAIESDIAKLEDVLRRAGRVIVLPPLERVKATCRAITGRGEPTDYDLRRHVLEGLPQLRMDYFDGDLEISGQVSIAGAATKETSSASKYSDSGINGYPSNFAPIPFILKKRVA